MIFSNQAQIDVYTELSYCPPGDTRCFVVDAESEKHEIIFSDLLEKTIQTVSYGMPPSLKLKFNDGSTLSIVMREDGRESFLVHGPDRETYIFDG